MPPATPGHVCVACLEHFLGLLPRAVHHYQDVAGSWRAGGVGAGSSAVAVTKPTPAAASCIGRPDGAAPLKCAGRRGPANALTSLPNARATTAAAAVTAAIRCSATAALFLTPHGSRATRHSGCRLVVHTTCSGASTSALMWLMVVVLLPLLPLLGHAQRLTRLSIRLNNVPCTCGPAQASVCANT